MTIRIYAVEEVASITKTSTPNIRNAIRNKRLFAKNCSGSGDERACWRITDENLKKFITPDSADVEAEAQKPLTRQAKSRGTDPVVKVQTLAEIREERRRKGQAK